MLIAQADSLLHCRVLTLPFKAGRFELPCDKGQSRRRGPLAHGNDPARLKRTFKNESTTLLFQFINALLLKNVNKIQLQTL